MAAPVWILSVDLQTKTATFQTGLGDAAKAARGAFNEIKTESGAMGSAVGGHMFEARHGVMLLGEEFGVHMPRALTAFITSIGPIGAAMEAAFPFLAIAVGATLLLQHLAALKEAGHQLTEDQIKFATEAQNAFNSLDEKLLQAGIRADELRNDHLGALKLQLELIDKQSMADLEHEFVGLAKIADEAFKELKTSWYSFSSGSDGAKRSLEDFQAQYESLLSKGDAKGASDLLSEKLERETRLLALRKEAQANSGSLFSAPKDGADLGASMRAQIGLKEVGSHFDEKAIEAQQALVTALSDQVRMQSEVADLKKKDSANAKTTVDKEGAARASAAARQAAESMMRMGEQSLAADRATADAQLTVHRASLEARLASDIDFAGRQRDIQLAGNEAEIAGLNKAGPDYQNQYKSLKEKTLEIGNEYDAKTAELHAKATIEESNRDLTELQQSEREKIEATGQGSSERLAAIDAAIQQEQAANLQDTSFFRELRLQRVKIIQQVTDEENKLKAEAGKEAAGDEEKSALLTLAAAKQHQQLLDSARRMSQEQLIEEEQKFATDEFNIKLKALQQDAAALDKSGKDYNNNLKKNQDQEKQLRQESANEIAAIREKAEVAGNQRILSASTQFNDALAAGLTSSAMGHETWAKAVNAFGEQVVSGMMENAIKSMLVDDMTKERDAAKAFRTAFNIGLSIGGPAGIVLGPVMGAAAFAQVMAFEGGTDAVPGVGRHDSVPSMLTPGEGVVPGGVMDGLRNMVKNGGLKGGGHTYNLQLHMTNFVHTIDGDGMAEALDKNSEQVQRHVENTLRKMNK
jgi:hypothetical protein